MHWLSIASSGLLALAPSADAQVKWKSVAATELGYAASFPGQPKMEYSDTNNVPKTSIIGSQNGVLCLVLVANYPGVIDPAEEFPASRDNFATGVKGTLAAQKQITMPRGRARLPALEFDVVRSDYNFRSIIVIDGKRAYQVSGGVPKGHSATDLERCVRGFRLLP